MKQETKEQFVANYCARSGVTVEFLRENGRVAVPADRDGSCDDKECSGWHMVRRSSWEEDVRYGIRPASDLELLAEEEPHAE